MTEKRKQETCEKLKALAIEHKIEVMTEKVQPRKESFTEYVRRLDVERDARKSAREAKQASGARYTWADFLPVESQRPKASDRIIIFELVKTEL